MSYLGRKGAVAPLTSADIPVGIVEGTDIAFLENASGTQNLGGTYSTERMYLNDSYTLTGDVTITGHLALGTIADSDVIITDDGSTRTITGSGTLETGELIHQRNPDLTGMTGELGNAVTGSPNLNLTTGSIGSGVTFPSGHVLQVVSYIDGTYKTHGSQTWLDLTTVSIDNVKSGSVIFITAALGGALTEASGNVGYRIEDSTGAVLVQAQSYTGGTNSWHGAVPTLIGKDNSPTVGTNTYTLRMQPSSSVTAYYNYGTSTNFDTRSFFQLMEVVG